MTNTNSREESESTTTPREALKQIIELLKAHGGRVGKEAERRSQDAADLLKHLDEVGVRAAK